MAIEDEILHEVNLSLSRSTLNGAFFEKLCANFKAANVSIPPLLIHQPKSLKEDLFWLVMSARDSRAGAQAHIPKLNVPPQLSKFWIDALMATVRECDEKFTPELERKWRRVLQQGMQSIGRARLPA